MKGLCATAWWLISSVNTPGSCRGVSVCESFCKVKQEKEEIKFVPCQLVTAFSAHNPAPLSEVCFKCAGCDVRIRFVFSLKPISLYRRPLRVCSFLCPTSRPSSSSNKRSSCLCLSSNYPHRGTNSTWPWLCGVRACWLYYSTTWFINTIKVFKCLAVCLFPFLAPLLKLSQHQLCSWIAGERDGGSTVFCIRGVLSFILEQNIRTFCLVDYFFPVIMRLSHGILYDRVQC